ncbi:NADH:ubiquinone oxidoreductase subunit L [Stenotrophomonas humi]|uniref:NADH:ubiquinone oxidoreductase subunit L n=1 Tax=Stenotrophomonas humi TaxID=405444 RepID=A0A0R0CDP1_9GAMM|nr:NADH-quinone oxidoreductase subunit L [Stenotrophomonas humi]KRG63956.1 NADH:ubiquinone oxidoreductase subunit L [Stenotrophomonas humi]
MEITLSKSLLIVAVLAPLLGSIIAGLFGRQVGRKGAQYVTILGVAVSFALSAYTLYQLLWGGAQPFNQNLYTFFEVGQYSAHVGFMIDRMTAMMMVVVTFVSLLVHIYSIGYMSEDDGYQRFFSYISLFTFSMLTLVMSNNFLQLFFGWEAVGVVSYLLIGFYFKKPSAIFANMKAFLVNRVGDFGFLLGIGGILWAFGSLDYATVFANASSVLGSDATGHAMVQLIGDHQWSIATVICICLFIGAMGKSAQVPLHVWLPDSMEGPTPISALIHAATMVTAGIFMVTRMSPLFELSQASLDFILFIGATTAFFTGLIGIVQNDIKRVVAYSTLSQLGYMTVALGVSAYSGAVFHLMTHAFFKALLFLGAGSVIIGMHHEQNMLKMGGLRKYMPITHITMWIGTLALVGTPFFSGFYSKDTIIEAAAHHAHAADASWVATYGYWAVLGGVIVTSFYSFRLLFLTFFGKERFRDAHDDHGHHGHGHDDHHGHGAHEPHESPWVVTVPLILLAIPSVLIGFFTIGPMLFGTGWDGHAAAAGVPGQTLSFFTGIVDFYDPARNTIAAVGAEFWHGSVKYAVHGMTMPAFWLTVAGFVLAWAFYVWKPELAGKARKTLAPVVSVLENKYGFDKLWIDGFAGGGVQLGKAARAVDSTVVDGVVVNGSARVVELAANLLRRTQSGFLYHYAFVMIIGLIALLGLLMHFWR